RDREVGPGEALDEAPGGDFVEEGDGAGGGGRQLAGGGLEVLPGGQTLAVEAAQGGAEGDALGGEGALQVPVAGGPEGHAAALPLHHQPGGDTLDPPGRQPGGDFLP